MPEFTDRLRLAELLCARISHDLGGMIGTLSGALEMANDPSVAAEAVSVAHQAALELRHRLELQRACWGPGTAPLHVPALLTFAEGLPRANYCRLDLAGLAPETVFPANVARVLLNLLMLAAEGLKGGGEIVLNGNSTDLVVAIVGPNAAWPINLATCLTSEAAAWSALNDPRSVLAPLTALLARDLGLRLSLLLPVGAGGPVPPLRLTAA